MRFQFCKILSALICVLMPFGIKAADVTLISTGDGATKELAVKEALVSAVEQAYGVYVSGNTIIFNDDLIRDEVVQITKGNVKHYTILNEAKGAGNLYSVILEATVSTDNLLKFAESKGATCELAGKTFAANMKLEKLYLRNAVKAMRYLYSTLEEVFAPKLYDYKVVVGEPYLYMNDVYIPVAIDCFTNENYKSFYNYYLETYSAIQNSIRNIKSTTRESNAAYEEIKNLNVKIKMLPQIWAMGFVLSDNTGSKIAPVFRGGDLKWSDFKWPESYKVKSDEYYKTCDRMKLNHHLIEIPKIGYGSFSLVVGGEPGSVASDGNLFIQKFSSCPLCTFRGDLAKSRNRYDYQSKLTEYLRKSSLGKSRGDFSRLHSVPNIVDSYFNSSDFDRQPVAFRNKSFEIDDSDWLNKANIGSKDPVCSLIFFLCYPEKDIEKISGFEVTPLSNN